MGFAQGTRRRIKRFGKVCYVPKLISENKQAIIDYAFRKLEEQGKASQNAEATKCKYRGGSNGEQLCCGAGFLIDDSEVVEDTGIRRLVSIQSVPQDIKYILEQIQTCHDYAAGDTRDGESKFVENLMYRKTKYIGK